MSEFEEVTILVERRKDCNTFYTIWSSGMITFCGLCECSTLDREFSLDSIKNVIDTLEEAIKRIKKYYKLEADEK